MLICSAGHDRPSRACSAPSSMPNDLKYKAIVAESCRGVQVESDHDFMLKTIDQEGRRSMSFMNDLKCCEKDRKRD